MNEHTNSQITPQLTDNKSKQKFSFELSDSGSSNELFLRFTSHFLSGNGPLSNLSIQ